MERDLYTDIRMDDGLPRRFWSKVALAPAKACWEWKASLTGGGYGQITVRGRRTRLGAHRVAYGLSFGPVPAGKFVCHRCDNKRCVNPTHLFLGTPKENSLDAAAKGLFRRPSIAQLTCRHGHAFTPENTYLRPRDGARICIACRRRRDLAAYYAGKKPDRRPRGHGHRRKHGPI